MPTTPSYLTFSTPANPVVLAGPQQTEMLLVTPGGVPGLPGPAGPAGPAGAVGTEPDLLDLTLLFENGLI